MYRLLKMQEISDGRGETPSSRRPLQRKDTDVVIRIR